MSPRLRCGGGRQREGETQTRTAWRRQRGAIAAGGGPSWSRRGRGRARSGAAAARRRLGRDREAGRSRPGAAGRDRGRERARFHRAVPPPAGGGPGSPRRGRAELRGGGLVLGRGTGNRNGARAGAALHAPEVNGKSCHGAARAPGSGGGARPRAPPASAGPAAPPALPRSTGAWSSLVDCSRPIRASAAAQANVDPVSAHLTLNPPLGCPLSPRPARTRVRSARGLSEPPRRSVSGSPLVFRCVGASTAASFATKPGVCGSSWGRAWGHRGEHACPSPGTQWGGGELAPTQPPARRSPSHSPALPRGSPGASAIVLLRPSRHRRPGRFASNPGSGPARFPGRPRLPVPVGVPAGPRSPCPASRSPGRPENSPSAETPRETGGRATRPFVEPERLRVPERTPRPVRPLCPGRSSPQPARAVGTAGQGRAQPRSSDPDELSARAETPGPSGPPVGAARQPGPCRRPVRLRA